MSNLPSTSHAPLLLFDAECVLCTRTAWFIDRRDRRRTLRMLPLKGDEGVALVAAHPELREVDSLVWVEPIGESGRRVLIYSDAVFAVGRYLGGGWGLLARVSLLVPRSVRDAAYRWVARHRHAATGHG